MTRSTAVAPRIEKALSLKTQLQQLAPRMKDVLPRHLTPERMMRLALLTYNRHPELADCTTGSLVEAVLVISSWGLEIGRTAHIVKFGNQATPIADYKGKIQLAINSGVVANVDARLVYEGDHFYYEYGLRERLEHRPAGKPGAKILGAYAIARLTTGGNKFEFMSVDEIEKIRKISKSGQKPDSAWVKHYGEMCKKTVSHRVLKTVPWSAELAQAYENDVLVEGSDGDEPITHAIQGSQAQIRAGGRQAPVVDGELGGEEEPTDEGLDKEITEREAGR